MDIIFVFGFFLMLLLTGVSLIGVIAALVVADRDVCRRHGDADC